MATNDEIQRLIVQVENQQEVERLTEAIKKQEATLALLMANESKHAPIVQAEAAALLKLTTQLDAATAATRKASSGMVGFGQAGLQTGRIIQDFAQGGIGGVLNNIEGFAMAIGAGPGLAGVLTALGIAFFIFKPQIDQFIKDMGLGGKATEGFKTAIEKLQARIKELADKPVKLAMDAVVLDEMQMKLEEIKAAIATFDRMKKSRSHYEKESGAEVGDIIAEESPEGAAALMAQIKNTIAQDLLAADETLAGVPKVIAEVEKKMAELDAELAGGVQDERAQVIYREKAAASKRIQDATEAAAGRKQAIVGPGGEAEKQAGRAFDRATSGGGEDLRKGQAALADLLRRTGERVGGATGAHIGGLAEGVEAVSPQDLMEQDIAEEEAQASIERQQRGIADRKKRAEREKAAAEKLKRERDKTEAEADKLAAEEAKRLGIKPEEDDHLGAGLEARVRRRIADERAKALEGEGGIAVDAQGRMGERDFRRIRDAAADEAVKQGMDPAEAGTRASATVERAQEALNQRVNAGMAQGMDLLAATQEAAAQAQHEVVQNHRMIVQRLKRLEANIARTRKDNAANRQEIEPIGAPNINFGGR